MSNLDIISAWKGESAQKKQKFQLNKVEERVVPVAGGNRGRFQIVKLEERIAARPSKSGHCTRA